MQRLTEAVHDKFHYWVGQCAFKNFDSVNGGAYVVLLEQIVVAVLLKVNREESFDIFQRHQSLDGHVNVQVSLATRRNFLSQNFQAITIGCDVELVKEDYSLLEFQRVLVFECVNWNLESHHPL